jgi:hypothetical protein
MPGRIVPRRLPRLGRFPAADRGSTGFRVRIVTGRVILLGTLRIRLGGQTVRVAGGRPGVALAACGVRRGAAGLVVVHRRPGKRLLSTLFGTLLGGLGGRMVGLVPLGLSGTCTGLAGTGHASSSSALKGQQG